MSWRSSGSCGRSARSSVTDLQAGARHRSHGGDGRSPCFVTVEDILAQALSNPIVGTIGLALGIAVVALWLAAAWWAYGDAARRTESSLAAFAAAGWIVVSTPLLLPLALASYRYVRPQVAAGDARSESLAIALSRAGVGTACPGCAAVTQAGWLRCPACATWLAAPCAACGAWSDPSFEICPHCAADGHGQPVIATMPIPEMAAGGAVVWSAPAAFWPGHEATAAGGSPAAVAVAGADIGQRGFRMASSSRPRSYATSRDSLSAPS